MNKGLGRAWLSAAAALFVVLTGATPHARAQEGGGRLPPNVGSGDCDRACLNGIADAFVGALLAHDPSKAPLARNARYSENGVLLPMPDGFWKNATGARPYRLYLDDPDWGTVGFFSRMYENGAPVVVTTRLKIYDRQITEIETIVGQENFGRGPLDPDLLGDKPRPQFLQQVPPASRRSREDLMKIVNTYFTGLENNVGDKPPLFAKDCDRLENGWHTTNTPLKPGQPPSSLSLSCIEDFAQGYHHNDTRLRNRRIMAIDLERQLVFAGVYFDHDNRADVRTYKVKSGQTVTVKETSPSTLGMHEIFQIDRDGRISQVEAVMTTVPYGMRPYFGTGFHMDSPQAVKDGFQEY
jgi:hypothetical protein